MLHSPFTGPGDEGRGHGDGSWTWGLPCREVSASETEMGAMSQRL